MSPDFRAKRGHNFLWESVQGPLLSHPALLNLQPAFASIWLKCLCHYWSRWLVLGSTQIVCPKDSHKSAACQVRAFSEWPGAKGRFYLQASDGKSKVIDLKIVTTRVKPPAAIREADGVVQLIDNALVVPCGERSALHILELQPPGKKIMGARDFCNGLRGHQILIEDTVESLTHWSGLTTCVPHYEHVHFPFIWR